MFRTVLIANRGEIACRAIKTARKMGVRTIAVCSEADRRSLHVRLADESVEIGPPPAADSYLAISRIVQACQETGAEAVYPGYGFLSENADFARALQAAGIVFIGPGPDAIEVMGDKIASKALAQSAGVNTIPGSNQVISDAEHAVQIAATIGYPVMLKASAGGGGKGMRLARNVSECRDGFQQASNEALASFGDGRVFIERFIEEPRHIEIQIMADTHGNTLYLNERECSIQRRHQKVIEETPSPCVDNEMRRAMGDQAVALAKAVGYRSAGTVEFMVDAQREFYFLEMNTRLQVEHPITEMVTGLDLVELMFRIAAGEALELRQEQVRRNGWAIEARIYAENPLRDFLPSTGRLVRYIPPAETDEVRIDSGIQEGDEVSRFYDPMMAKLITWGRGRNDALELMRRALDEFYLRGVASNIPFLAALLAHPRVLAGRLSTNLIAEEYPSGFSTAQMPDEDPALLVVVAATIHRRYLDRAANITGQMPGHEREVAPRWIVIIHDQPHSVTVLPIGQDHEVRYRETCYRVRSDWQFGKPLFRCSVNGKNACVQVERRGFRYQLYRHGIEVEALVLSPRAAELWAHMPSRRSPASSKFLLAPMPGLLVSVQVEAGQRMHAGEPLAVVEAMKMENHLRADHDCTIARVLAAPGDELVVDQPILEFAASI